MNVAKSSENQTTKISHMNGKTGDGTVRGKKCIDCGGSGKFYN